jgi:hypothetical protein
VTYTYRYALVLASLAFALAACSGGGDTFPDANTTDGNTTDTATVDITPPDTLIDTPPASPNNLATVHVGFSATDDTVPLNVTFGCKLDGVAVTPCVSPIDLPITTDGVHTFEVAATDLAGNTDPTPAMATWTTDLTPPDTTITDNPPLLDNAADVQFSFTSTEAGTFECQLDGGAFAACATMFDVLGLGNGSHTFNVRAIDAVGNVDPTPATYTWTIDLSTPNTVIDSGPTGSVQATTATFTFSSPNAGAGATFDCGLDGAALTPCGSTSTITYSGLAEGDHTFTVRVTNMAGTSDPTPESQTWNVDHTGPVVTITTGPTGLTNDATPSFDFTVTGNPVTIECRVDADPFVACTSPYVTATLSQGAHTVEVHAIDLAGNTGNDTQTFTVDTLAPDTTILSGPVSPISATSAPFTFSASEAGSTFECALDGAAFAACTTPKTYAGLIDGMHMLLVRATDPAGNVDLTPATYAWTVDTLAPDTTILTNPAALATVATAAFTYSSSETGATFECKLDGAAFGACAAIGQSYSGLGEGAHTFQVRSRDAASNVDASPATYAWTVDTTAPTVAFGALPPALSNLATTTIPFSSPSDATATFECATSAAGPFTACTSPKTYATPANTVANYTIYVRAVDTAGNTGAAITYSWQVDTQAPTVVFGTLPAALSNLATTTIPFSSPSDATATFECAAAAAGPFTACTSPKSYATAANTVANYTIYVRAIDTAGNTGAAITYSWQVDRQAPTVAFGTLPAALSNLATTTIPFTSPSDATATFECAAAAAGPFTACSSPKTYATPANTVANYTIYVHAVDAAGNTGAAITYSWQVDTQAPTVAFGTLPAALSNLATTTIPFSSPSDASATFECAAAAAGPFTACSSPQSYATAANAVANYTIYVRAVDTAGNTGAAITYSWQVDRQAPTVAFGTLPAALSNLATTTIPFSSPSDASATFECAAAAAGPFTACTSPKSYATAANTVANYTIYVRAVDTASNTSAAITYSWQVDTQAPTVAFGALPAAVSNLATTTIPFSSNDATATFECAAAAAGPFTGCSSPKTYATAANTVANYTIYVRAVDTAGNTGAAITYSWQVDTQAPTIAFGTLPAAVSNLATTTIPFSSNDAAATFQCAAAAAGPFSACTSPQSYATAANTIANYTIFVFAKDAAGNVSNTITYSWQVDTQAPTIAFGTLPAAVSNLATTTIPFSSNDAAATFQCAAAAAGPFSACTSPQTYTTAANTIANYTIFVFAKDAAGNVSNTITYSWQVDTQAPTIAFGTLPALLSNAPTTTVPFSSNDPAATFQCAAAAAGPFSACTSPKSYATAANTIANYTIFVFAKDAAGNVSNTITYSWQVDTQVPTIAFGTLPAAVSNQATTTIPFSSNDAAATFQCAATAAGPFSACTSPQTYTTAANTIANYTIFVFAKDAAGNVSNTITYGWQVDTQAPTIAFGTLPALLSNAPTTTVPFSSPSDATATFQCAALAAGPFSACTSPQSYATAANTIANYAIFVFAKDAAGNVSNTITYSWQVDTQAPDTTIATNPVDPSASSAGSFTYTATETATFECSLDNGAFLACASTGVTYSSLSNGVHIVQVRAKDSAGNYDLTPDSYTWTVNTNGPLLTQVPPAGWTVNYFTFQWGLITGAPTYQCNITAGLPAASWFGCGAGAYNATNASYGAANTFGVRWVDAAGVASSATSTSWTPNTGLVLYYPHDQDAKNYSILDFPTQYYGHHGSTNPIIQGGLAGGAGWFNAGTAYKGTIQPLQSGVAYTVGLWFTAAVSDIVSGPLWSNVGVDGGCLITEADATIVLKCYSDNGVTLVGQVASAIPGNRWTHVAFEYNGLGHGTGKGGPVTLFINGNPIGQIANPSAFDFFPARQLQDMSTGKFRTPTQLDDELRIYNRGLNGKELCEQMAFGVYSALSGSCTADPGSAIAFDNFPTATPVLQRGRHSTTAALNGNTVAVFPTGIFGRSLENVTFSEFDLGNFNKDINNDADHTITVWFFDDGSGSGGTIFNFMEGSGMQALVSGSKLTINVRGINPLSGATTTASDSVGYQQGAWHSLVIASAGSTDIQGNKITPRIDLFLDGKQWSSLPLGSTNVFQSVLPSLVVGPRNTGETNLAVDELKIWAVDLRKFGPATYCQVADGGLYDWVNLDCTLPTAAKPF